jgi:Excalibur calcium-binding domain
VAARSSGWTSTSAQAGAVIDGGMDNVQMAAGSQLVGSPLRSAQQPVPAARRGAAGGDPHRRHAERTRLLSKSLERQRTTDCPLGTTVYVTGSGPHGLDREGDGVACESY